MTDTLPMPFAGALMDHAEHTREPAHIEKYLADKRARTILFHNKAPGVNKNGALILAHPSELIGRNLEDPGPIFLGLYDGRPYFTAALETPDNLAEIQDFQQMRAIAGRLKPYELALAGRAKSLHDWHLWHRFCSTCGKPSRGANGGIARKCPSCGTNHFPRVNPVVIMLVLHEDHCLMGRGHGWPDGAFSALAGFMSPGETMEEACYRETLEEVGLKTHSHRYVFSQPWPFPSQLMMGMICEADSREITVDKKELDDAKWFSRETIEAVFMKRSDAFLRPPKFTIAHQLIRHWLGM